MKLKVIMLMAGIFFATTNLNDLFGQSSQLEVITKKSDRGEIGKYSDFETKEGNSSAATINNKALRNFERDYKNVQARTWYRMKDGYLVKFQLDGITNQAYYDYRGAWTATSRQYGEDKLPESVLDVVKSNYYQYKITTIVEIVTRERTAYVVALEGKTSWMKVRVMNDQLDVLENFKKSN